MILVTGATGTVGSHVVRELVAAGQQVRAFVTDTSEARKQLGEKVEYAQGKFEDKASIEAALRGVTKLYLLVPFVENMAALEATVIDAAKRAGVRHVVKHSVSGAQYEPGLTIGRAHRAGEKLLEASGMAWTFLRPVGFMSNAFGWAPTVKSQGAIYQPMGSGKMAVIDPRDIASVGAKALTTSGHEGKAYDLTGPEALDMTQQAKILGDAIGKPVKYVDVPDSAARDAMLGMGMPKFAVDALIEFTNLVRAGNAAM
ncbi:MAG TPA: SDR family oxidoreductase, partial [Kofleriaceae bacterium]|nr:SDR family oxidoreductase [Kofleriaceae bacterium]